MSTANPAHALLEPAATRVRDPRSGRSAWVAGLIGPATLTDDALTVTLRTTAEHSDEDRRRVEAQLRQQIQSVGWGGAVHVRHDHPPAALGPGDGQGDSHGHSHEHSHGHSHGHAAPAPAPKKPDPVKGMSGPGMGPHGGPIQKLPLAGVAHVVAVASGKGGVGKSTVSTQLAIGLQARGLRVGLMDADIYGPSLPTMMGVQGRPFVDEDKRIIPLEAHGVKCMSIGFLVDEREPVIWRGPMVMGVVRQFLQEVQWGPLDVLLIDLPPGTGDAQLTMIQAVDLAGAVVVTTPQQVAVADAVRGIEMFRKLNVPVLGIVENMSWMDLPGGGRAHPFGTGGGARTATEYGVPLLTQVPLDGAIREAGDAGQPGALPEGPAATAFRAVAAAVAHQLGL